MAKPANKMTDAVGERARRKLRARQETERGIWFGLGMFGVIGWSVAIPMLIGVALGIWLDRTRPTTFSWTLTLLVLGIALGCLNAWLWVSREREALEKREGEGKSEGDEGKGRVKGSREDCGAVSGRLSARSLRGS